MKTIEDAVIELSGKLPNKTYTKRCSAAGWYISLYDKLAHAVDCVWFSLEEFEATARRMGYINGYRYGVECATNGKKPDLPDDCQVRWFDGVETGETSAGWLNWHGVIKFEIIDQHHKPEQPEPAQQKTWFEAGELPPVNAEFESYFSKDTDPKWNRGKVAYSSNKYTILIFDDGEENLYHTKDLKRAAKFRPIKTDREKAIDAAKSLKAFQGDEALEGGWVEFISNALYDAGLLRLPK